MFNLETQIEISEKIIKIFADYNISRIESVAILEILKYNYIIGDK